jgi:sulfite reductase (ferredoxin)
VVTAAVKRVFDKYGNRKNRNEARLRFLWQNLGEERFRQVYEEEVARLRAENPAPLTILEPPPNAEAPDLPPPIVDEAEFHEWKRRFVEPQRQAGVFSVLVPVFLGNLRSEDAIRLADLVASFGPHVLRATLGQNLRLRDIPEISLGRVWSVVRELGEIPSVPRVLANAVACTGADTCKLGMCLSKGALRATVDGLLNSGLRLDDIPDFRLNFSGCRNSCGQHLLADLGLFGNPGRHGRAFPAYDVVAGTRLADGQARLAGPIGQVKVNARDVPGFVRDVLARWIENKDNHPSFAAYVDADGTKDILAIAERYRAIPDFDEDRSYYTDWGADEPFSLAGRSAGECSAGLFDLIQLDLKTANRLRNELKAGIADKDGALYRITLLSARALMITLGKTAVADGAVFEAFRQDFIEAGLIDKRFDHILTAASVGDKEGLRRHETDVIDLVPEVERLFRSMDDSLRLSLQPA